MTPQHMQAKRDDIAKQTKVFLRKGGKIQIVPAGWEPPKQEVEAQWISTMEAAKLIGVTYAKLTTWRGTNASCPRNRKSGKSIEWFLPSVIAFAEDFQGKRYGRKAA